MKKKILAVAILVVSMLAVGCSNTQDLGMSFEEFKEKYNENVRREGLPSEYLIRYDNVEYYDHTNPIIPFASDEKKYNAFYCTLPTVKIGILTNVENNKIFNIEVWCDKYHNETEKMKKLILGYSLVAMCFDERWKDISFSKNQVDKLLDDDVYTKENVIFCAMSKISFGDPIFGDSLLIMSRNYFNEQINMLNDLNSIRQNPN